MIDAKIFAGLSEEEYYDAMKHIDAGEFSYARGQIIFSAGDIAETTGLILSGSVLIESNDIWGNTALLGIMKAGELFAVTYALLGEPLLVDVRANENCRVLFLRVNSLANSGTWSFKLTKNLLTIIARKNLHLSERSFINANRSIRRKVMSFLQSVSLKEERAKDFYIPFDRQQMADYLNVERSALSKELSAMRDDGIIDFHKNHFFIHEQL